MYLWMAIRKERPHFVEIQALKIAISESMKNPLFSKYFSSKQSRCFSQLFRLQSSANSANSDCSDRQRVY